LQRGEIDPAVAGKISGHQPRLGRTLIRFPTRQLLGRDFDNEALPVHDGRGCNAGDIQTAMHRDILCEAQADHPAYSGCDNHQPSPTQAAQHGHPFLFHLQTPNSLRDVAAIDRIWLLRSTIVNRALESYRIGEHSASFRC
jgi:hypothetical protein